MPVLQRQELEGSPLADLHAIASELGLEGFRGMRKQQLIDAILAGQGGEGDEAAAPTEAAEEEAPAREAPAEDVEAEPEPEAEVEAEPEPEREPEPEPEPEEEQRSGVLDILGNGSGFVRPDPSTHSPEDVYLSPAQIRRCELRAGDEVAGPVRPPRRSERHPSLVRVEQVNGQPAEPPQERPAFLDLTAVFPSERLSAPAGLEAAPFGKGSRVAVSDPPEGAPAAGAGALLRTLARTLADSHSELQLTVVLAGIRPEEVTEWRREEGLQVMGEGVDRAPDALAQVAELAVERGKRAVERGQDAALVIDSLEALPAPAQRKLFGAARKAEEGGSLTVVGATGRGSEVERIATTRIALEAGSGADPAVDQARSGTLRGELLG